MYLREVVCVAVCVVGVEWVRACVLGVVVYGLVFSVLVRPGILLSSSNWNSNAWVYVKVKGRKKVKVISDQLTPIYAYAELGLRIYGI